MVAPIPSTSSPRCRCSGSCATTSTFPEPSTAAALPRAAPARCIVDGEPVRSCALPVSAAVGKKIVTIEGLSEKGLHRVQQAWIEHEVPQCGYCQTGMIMSAAALLAKNPEPTDADIDADDDQPVPLRHLRPGERRRSMRSPGIPLRPRRRRPEENDHDDRSFPSRVPQGFHRALRRPCARILVSRSRPQPPTARLPPKSTPGSSSIPTTASSFASPAPRWDRAPIRRSPSSSPKSSTATGPR